MRAISRASRTVHAFVVKRESSEKGFPYLLGTQLLGRTVGVENFHSVSERGPEILKTVIKDVFKRVVVVLIQCHPSILMILLLLFLQKQSLAFSVVDCKVCLGSTSEGEGVARENPAKLDAEDQEEAINMSGKVLVLLDTTVFKCGIIRWKVGFAPGAMTVVIAVSSAACATAESTTISRSVVLVVRHVSAAVSKTWKVNAGPAECNSESSAASITQTVTRSAQIEHAVSVHQGSLIH